MWTIEQVKIELDKLRVADGLPVIQVPINANGRLTRTLGRVRFSRYSCEPICIEFAQRLLDNGTDNDIINVIKHEYAHYYLLVVTGENHGHDALFKQKCREIGCTHEKTHNKLESSDDDTEQEYKYEVWCDDCHKMIGTYSRICKTLRNIEYCQCGVCRGSNLRVKQNW